jgi:hypothetical protein
LSRRDLRARLATYDRFEKLARGPFFEPVVEVVRAYLDAAIPEPAGTEGVYWALSCLPGTTPRRLSALTMRITDILVLNRPASGPPAPVDALVIVARSTLAAGFGSQAAAQRSYPRLHLSESDYHGAGMDQLMISGPAEELARCLRDARAAAAARAMASQMMASGRVLHWRGHNPLLVDHALGRSPD